MKSVTAAKKLAAFCLDPDGATPEEKAAWWETQYRHLAKQETKARKDLAELLAPVNGGVCPATWEHITGAVKKVTDRLAFDEGRLVR